MLMLSLLVSIDGISQNLKSVKVGPEEKINLKIPETFIRMTDQDRMKQV